MKWREPLHTYSFPLSPDATGRVSKQKMAEDTPIVERYLLFAVEFCRQKIEPAAGNYGFRWSALSRSINFAMKSMHKFDAARLFVTHHRAENLSVLSEMGAGHAVPLWDPRCFWCPSAAAQHYLQQDLFQMSAATVKWTSASSLKTMTKMFAEIIWKLPYALLPCQVWRDLQTTVQYVCLVIVLYCVCFSFIALSSFIGIS